MTVATIGCLLPILYHIDWVFLVSLDVDIEIWSCLCMVAREWHTLWDFLRVWGLWEVPNDLGVLLWARVRMTLRWEDWNFPCYCDVHLGNMRCVR